MSNISRDIGCFQPEIQEQTQDTKYKNTFQITTEPDQRGDNEEPDQVVLKKQDYQEEG